MELRPLADRVAGLDQALVAHCGDHLTHAHLTTLRFAVADFVKRHGDVLDRLADGTEPWELIADGVILSWPDDAEVEGGWPRRGIELGPVAEAVLAAAPADLPDAAQAASSVYPRQRDDEDLAADVVGEMIDALVFAVIVGS